MWIDGASYSEEMPLIIFCHRNAGCFVQVVNVLNGELSTRAAHALMEAALSTLTALIVGSDAQRLRLRCDVGYDALHDVLASQVRCFKPAWYRSSPEC